MASNGCTGLERFLCCMEYKPCDRRPNYEMGMWKQTQARWQREAPPEMAPQSSRWAPGEPRLGIDPRQFIPVNYGMIPPYEEAVLEDLGPYEIVRNAKGIVSKALKEGALDGQRMSMNEYIAWPIRTPADWPDLKRRLLAGAPGRHTADLDACIPAWKQRSVPLCLGSGASANGFYWRAREFMGTENLSYAWYDYPDMMHEIMEFFADFLIETSRPVLAKIPPDYFTFNEDMSMKNGPLLSPQTYRTFIYPHFKRVVEFFKANGVKYVALDTDGNPTKLIPMLMDAGVDAIWPIERASDVSPQDLRRQFGRDLRLWGGVDKRVLPRGQEAIKAHLLEFAGLIEEGGFIPHVDHHVPPDVSWDNFRHYLDAKRHLLAGEFSKLG